MKSETTNISISVPSSIRDGDHPKGGRDRIKKTDHGLLGAIQRPPSKGGAFRTACCLKLHFDLNEKYVNSNQMSNSYKGLSRRHFANSVTHLNFVVIAAEAPKACMYCRCQAAAQSAQLAPRRVYGSVHQHAIRLAGAWCVHLPAPAMKRRKRVTLFYCRRRRRWSTLGDL